MFPSAIQKSPIWLGMRKGFDMGKEVKWFTQGHKPMDQNRNNRLLAGGCTQTTMETPWLLKGMI
jgi:hypothetical protein